MSGIYSVWGPAAAEGAASVHADFNDQAIRKHLAALAVVSSKDFESARREIGEFFLGEVQDNLDGQKLFDGTPMPQSNAAQGRTTTWKRDNKAKGRVKGGVRDAGKTLIDTHDLYDRYTQQLTRGGVEIGSALIYAAIHHFGGETGQHGHRFQMTARPVLGATERHEHRIGDILIAAIVRTQ